MRFRPLLLMLLAICAFSSPLALRAEGTTQETGIAPMAIQSGNFFKQPTVLPNPAGEKVVSVAIGTVSLVDRTPFMVAGYAKDNFAGSRVISFTKDLVATEIQDTMNINNPQALAVADLSGGGPSDVAIGFEHTGFIVALQALENFGFRLHGNISKPNAAVSIPGIVKDNIVFATANGLVVLSSSDQLQTAVSTVSNSYPSVGPDHLAAGFSCPAAWFGFAYAPASGPVNAPGVQVFCGNGLGNFALAQDIPRPDERPVAALAIGDLNGDGKPELITANGDSGKFARVYTYGQQPNGLFQSTPMGTWVTSDGIQSLHVVDVNYDGKLDLVGLSLAFQKITVMLGDGMGNFSATYSEPMPNYASTINPNGSAVTVENGRVVVYVANYNSGIERYEQEAPPVNRNLSLKIGSANGDSVTANFGLNLGGLTLPARANLGVTHTKNGALVNYTTTEIAPQTGQDLNAEITFFADAQAGNNEVTIALSDLSGNVLAIGKKGVNYVPAFDQCEKTVSFGSTKNFVEKEVYPNPRITEPMLASEYKASALGRPKAVLDVVSAANISSVDEHNVVHFKGCSKELTFDTSRATKITAKTCSQVINIGRDLPWTVDQVSPSDGRGFYPVTTSGGSLALTGNYGLSTTYNAAYRDLFLGDQSYIVTIPAGICQLGGPIVGPYKAALPLVIR